jgi:hypothetical protein
LRVYLWLQQSPGQQEEFWCWQQVWPQQAPGQHFAFFLQQAAPVAARADRANRDVAIRAKSLVFIEISSRGEKGCSAHERRRGNRFERGLDAEIVFEAENGGPEEQAARELTGGRGGGLRNGWSARGAIDGRSFGGIADIGFLEGPVRALNGRALCSVIAGARATGHLAAMAVHGGGEGGVRAGQGDEPDGGEGDAEELPQWQATSDHEASLSGGRARGM